MEMTCPRCSEPLKGGEKQCPACKKPFTAPPDRVGSSSAGVKCPICKIGVYPGKMAGQDALHCAECKGMGLKREAMMKMQPGGPKQFVAGPEEADHKTPPYFEKRNRPPFLICPFCNKRMKEDKLGPMKVDQCETCTALWLSGDKSKHLNDLIGPYKWKASKGGSSGGSSRRRR